MGFTTTTQPKIATKEEVDESSEDEMEALASKLEDTSLEVSDDRNWSKSPFYAPLYLDTESEYLPSTSKTPKIEAKIGSTGGSGGEDWSREGWENSQNIDDVFDKFSSRVELRGAQCIR